MRRWTAVLLAAVAVFATAAAEAAAGVHEQYTSKGHVLGFESTRYSVSNGTYALCVEFDGARPVAPHDTKQPATAITYSDLWPGITVTYDTPPDGIARSTWTIAPGADPAAIRLRYNRAVKQTPAGNLEIVFDSGVLTESRPVAWQDIGGHRRPVEVAFAQLAGDLVGFRVGRYRTDLPLTIDPTLTWNTFFGGLGQDSANALALDASGDIYVTGDSSATWGSPLRAYSSGDDAFVAKLSPTGALLWSTFLGGGGVDSGQAIALDDAGDVYVTGFSTATWGTPLRPYVSFGDAFAARLTSAGALAWSTFLGGAGVDSGSGIAVGGGNVYVAGSSDAPWGNPLNTYTSSYDAFVTQLTTAGALGWNTFVGGSDYDFGYAIAAAGGDVVVAGESHAPWGMPLRAYSGSVDAFVARFTAAGAIVWNTFLGSAGGADSGQTVGVDGAGNIYVAGFSSMTWGAPIRAHASSFDGFAARLSPAGALSWNTFLGGKEYDTATAIAVDDGGEVYVTGSSDATWGSPVRSYGGLSDAFAARLTSAGERVWNTFLGSDGEDVYDAGDGIAIAAGGVYVAGFSEATWGTPLQPFTGVTDEAFVARLPADAPHDSVVLPPKPLTIKIRSGHSSATRKIKVRVRNADLLTDTGTGHVIQLVADDGDCPAGTIVGLPDFDRGTAGAQDAIAVGAGKTAKAIVTLNLAAAAFDVFNGVAPERCALHFSVSSPGHEDEAPGNNSVPMELNVFDANDAGQSALHESFIESLKPLKISIGSGKPEKAKTAKPKVGNGDVVPVPESSEDGLVVTGLDGDCPPGTLGIADYDPHTPGQQNLATVAGGETEHGKLPVTATAAGFTAAGKKSPARCVATVTVNGPGGDTDVTNNTTRLVIDVYDKNDF